MQLEKKTISNALKFQIILYCFTGIDLKKKFLRMLISIEHHIICSRNESDSISIGCDIRFRGHGGMRICPFCRFKMCGKRKFYQFSLSGR